MRALITGMNGFVGGHLAERLLADETWDVWGTARQPPAAGSPLAGRVRHVVADFTRLEEVVATLEQARPDVVFHLAGQSYVPRSFEDPNGTLTTNILSAACLFQAVLRLRQDPLLVIVSSNEIYGMVRPEELPVGEDTPFRPVSPYAVSKAAQDLLAYQYHVSHGLRTVRLRPFNHIGPRQSDRFVASAFAAQIARVEAGQQPPVLRVGNLSAERDFTDVRDMVAAYELAARRCRPGEVYNVSAGRVVSIRWILETLLAFSERDIVVEPDPTRMRPADVPRIECDSSRFRTQTGWEPRITLEQTLHDILEHWRAQI